jgi:putative transposase
MSQPIRICRPNTIYFCTSRCIELRNLFTPVYVKKLAIIAINMAMRKYSFKLIHINIADNHFNIIIKTTNNGETVSRILQYIKARIAEKYNQMANRTGAFWNERFKSWIIESANYLTVIFHHIVVKGNPGHRGSIYGLTTKWFGQNSIRKTRLVQYEHFPPLFYS